MPEGVVIIMIDIALPHPTYSLPLDPGSSYFAPPTLGAWVCTLLGDTSQPTPSRRSPPLRIALTEPHAPSRGAPSAWICKVHLRLARTDIRLTRSNSPASWSPSHHQHGPAEKPVNLYISAVPTHRRLA